LEGIPRNWYTELEQFRETTSWEEMKKNFVITFAFEHDNLEIDTTLKLVSDRTFEEPELDIVIAYKNQKR
jgi:hypothetical protein